MLLLASINDRLELVTSTGATINVHASYIDSALSGAITPGRRNSIMGGTPATVSIAGSPPASTQRNVKTLHVRNVHPTQAVDVTVQHVDGVNTNFLYRTNLQPGRAFEFTDQTGFAAL